MKKLALAAIVLLLFVMSVSGDNQERRPWSVRVEVNAHDGICEGGAVVMHVDPWVAEPLRVPLASVESNDAEWHGVSLEPGIYNLQVQVVSCEGVPGQIETLEFEHHKDNHRKEIFVSLGYERDLITLDYLTVYSVRTIRLDGGVLTIRSSDQRGGFDLLEEINDNGELSSKSICYGPHDRYDALVEFFREFQERVKAGDRDSVISMLQYPVRIGRGSTAFLNNREEALHAYDDLFARDSLERLEGIDPRDVFCKAEGAMVGNGMLWANARNGQLAIITINR